MAFYEKYTGRSRDSFTSLEDAQQNYRLTWPDDFNFAYDVIDILGTEKPDKLAMLWVSANDEEKRITFGDMMTESNRVAKYLYSSGIRKGDPVLLVLKRSYLFWYCMLALHKIGAIAVQATHMLTAKDYIYRCNAGEIKAVIITGDGDCTEHFDEGADKCETVGLKFVTKHKSPPGGGWLDFESGFEAMDDNWTRLTGDEKTMATDTMLMSFSSGTTGYPKMILHDFTYPLGHIMTGVFWHRVVDGGLHFTISDTGWLKSLWGKMYGQWLGESAVFTYDFEKFDPTDILSKLDKYKITTFCVPPTMYRFLLQQDVTKYDLSSLKHCCTAGEALNPQIFEEWKHYTGLEIYEGFGQTETTLCISTIYPLMKPVPGCIGLATPGYDVRIINEQGEECEPGVTGEVCIAFDSMETRPRGLLKGYYKNPEETARAMHDGYYHTGDTAYRDENGLFNYVGRNDDVIKSSGYRIGPFEVESVMLEHPAVLEVAVTGVPDTIRGFNVKATVVLKNGYTASDELAHELQEYVKKNTAPYKYPRVIEFVDSLPKTISGKIRRVEIRQNDMNKMNK
jgi:acetyl-CoA synthetase